MEIRQRPTSNELVMSWPAFRDADYGQLCQRLGLSPSRPGKSAAQLARRRS